MAQERVRFLSVTVLASLVASAALAAPPDVPDKLVAEPGQLVRIVVKADDVGVLKNFTDSEAFWGELVGPKGERHYVFQAPAKNPRHQYVVGWWRKGETEGTSTTITVGAVPPGPTPPDPPTPPTPKPDGALGLVKASRDGLAAVAGQWRPQATALANAQRSTASALAAGGIPDDPAKILAAWRSANNATVDPKGWEPWGKTVSARLSELYAGGKLPTKSEWAAAFREVAEGLE
jgi:hypothetical protein